MDLLVGGDVSGSLIGRLVGLDVLGSLSGDLVLADIELIRSWRFAQSYSDSLGPGQWGMTLI